MNRKIDITTTQNVTIQYNLASLQERITAFFIDWSILGLVLTILAIALVFIDGSSTLFTIIIVPILFFYTLFWEIFWEGQSPGKKSMNIKVVKINGKKPNVYDYVLRWTFRLIDIYFSVGTLASILIQSSTKAQRMGGVVSNTTVISLQSKIKVELSDILKIESKANREVQYPKVQQYTEKEMLLLKRLIDRHKRYPNPAHKKLISQTCQTLKEQMELTDIPKNEIEFLKEVIRDYVVLTR